MQYLPDSDFPEYSDLGRSTIRRAEAEAMIRGDKSVGTEHILLALIKGRSCVVKQVFKRFGCKTTDIRKEVERLLQPDIRSENRGLLYTLRAERAVRFAEEEAYADNKTQIDPEDLLIGLLREYEGVAHHVLNSLGLDVDSVRREVWAITKE